MNIKPRLTILNIYPPAVMVPPNVTWIVGDARCMPFENKSFDVVFSNSVIEHVGSFEDQLNFAQEVRRVGKRYFVQTPNYYFPIEPHFLAPFIHFLPLSVRKKLLVFTGRYLFTRDKASTLKLMDEVRLLKPKEMALLFPDAIICYERVLGVPKSIIAIRT